MLRFIHKTKLATIPKLWLRLEAKAAVKLLHGSKAKAEPWPKL